MGESGPVRDRPVTDYTRPLLWAVIAAPFVMVAAIALLSAIPNDVPRF